MEVFKQSMMVFSTGHINKQDDNILRAWSQATAGDYKDADGGVFWTCPTSYGYILWADADSIPEALDAGLSPAICQLVQIAKDHGCEWIRFDCDVPVDKSLPTFSW
jgi:hypothetical protein